jgi:hypothetical protein
MAMRTTENDPGAQSVIYRLRVGLSASPTGRGKIVSVIVVNPLINADLSGNVLTLLVGDGASQPYPLLPGEKTVELFFDDLRDCYVRVAAAVGPVNETDAVLIVHRYTTPVKDMIGWKPR